MTIAATAAAARGADREAYLTVLTWAFTFFNSARTAAYLPTVWAILRSGDSSQHSLWTWLTWLGANITMALWLRERNSGRLDRAALVNVANAGMCCVVLAAICWVRW